uniref:Uncharacterized protein n=1 Tax=Anguilla anguilla TaxID=7936 RepID=A0A0E9SJF2_ANGAN
MRRSSSPRATVG